MFNINIDNRFFLVAKEINVFTDIFSLMMKNISKHKVTDKYDQKQHSIDLAYAVKTTEGITGVSRIKEPSNEAHAVKFIDAPVLTYLSRSGVAIYSQGPISLTYDYYDKMLSIYRSDSNTMVSNNIAGLEQMKKLLEFTAPELLKPVNSASLPKETKKKVTRGKTKKAVKEAPAKQLLKQQTQKEEVTVPAVAIVTDTAVENNTIPVVKIQNNKINDDDIPSLEDVLANQDIFLSEGNANIDNE